MSKKFKISVFISLFIVAVFAVIQFQAKRIVVELIEVNASDRVEVKIGRLKILPHKSSIRMQDVVVTVKDKDSDNYKRSTVKKVFLDVNSLWDFFFGGTLVIEKLECEGGELTMYDKSESKRDASKHGKFDLSSTIERIKKDAIRFRIQEISFLDFSLILLSDSAKVPTAIKHLTFRAHDFYLSADSILKKKPLVEFSLPAQTIEFHKGLSVSFDSLFFSTADNSIQIDKLDLLSPDNELGNTYRIHSDEVRVAHFNFETLYTKGVIIIDSVFLSGSKFSLAWQMADQNHPTKSSGLPALPEMNIKHLIVNKLAADIKLSRDSIVNSFSVDNSFVTLEDFRHTPDSSHIVSTRNFNIVLTKYATFLSNKHTSISFDTVRLQKYQLSLLNFKFNTADQKQPVLQTSVFELKQVDWYSLLVNRKLVADEAIVLNPTVHASFKPGKQSSPSGDLVIVNSLKEFLEVELFSMKNATAYITFLEKNANVVLSGFNTTVHVNDVLESKNVNEALGAIEEFSFRLLHVTSPDVSSQVGNFNYHQGMSSIGQATYKAGDEMKFDIMDARIGKIDWNQSRNNITLGGLGWKSVNVELHERNQSSRDKSKGSMPSVYINNIRGGTTKVGYHTKDLILTTLLQQLYLERLQLGDTNQVKGIAIMGNRTDMKSGQIESSISAFSITDHGGTLENFRLKRMAVDSLETSIDQIVFKADVQTLAQRKIVVDQLDFRNMKTHYSKRDSMQSMKFSVENDLSLSDIGYTNKKLAIGSLLLESGPIDFLHEKKVNRKEELPGISPEDNAKKVRTRVDTLFHATDSMRNQLLKVKKFNSIIETISPDDPLFTINSTALQSGPEGITLSISNMETAGLDSSMVITAKINSLKFKEVHLNNNALAAHITTGSINDLAINSAHLKEPWKVFQDNYPTAAIDNLKARIETGGNFIQFDRFDYDPSLKNGTVQGIEFRPLKDRQTFLDDNFFQTNFIHAKINSISLNRFDVDKLAKDSVIDISSIHVLSPQLEIGRDKTHPFYSKNIKLLPTNAFQKIGVKFKIDSLQFSEGQIRYIEKSRITHKEGTLDFTKLWGLVRNVKNIDIEEGDTLYIRGGGKFLDSATVNIRVRESYRDTLAGFLMTTQVSPFHTSILNPTLVPMVAVEFQSGYVDTIQMRAVGREYLSLGKMKFFYRDLKVNFLDKTDTSKHSAKNVILKFAANTFVIRPNNSDRTGVVFFERDRHRAVFQYWIKMILSGITTSAGAKSNRRQIKKYMKDLNQKKLPPIDEDL